MDDLVAWGARISVGFFAFLALVYGALAIERGEMGLFGAAGAMLVAAGIAALVARRADADEARLPVEPAARDPRHIAGNGDRRHP